MISFLRRIFLVLLLGGWACQGPPPTLPSGAFQELRLLRDASLAHLDKRVRQHLTTVYHTPHEDPLYEVIPLTPDSFLARKKGYQQTLWLSTPSSPTHARFQEIFHITAGLAHRRGLFRENDFLIGMAAPSWQTLDLWLDQKGDSLKQIFLSNTLKLLRSIVYYPGRDARMERRVEARGFHLDIPRGYAVFAEGDRVIGLAKHEPTRFLMAVRLPGVRHLDSAAVVALRDSLASVYYEGERVLPSTVVVETVRLGSRTVRVLTGAWEHPEEPRGGAFRTYAWTERGETVLLDTGVFAPDRQRKIPLLLRLQVIASTFRFLD